MNSTTKRKLIITGGGLLVLLVSFGISELLANKETPPRKAPERGPTTVFTNRVENKTVNSTLEASGRLQADQSIELFAEVQGVMESGSKPFKPGVEFSKGQVFLNVRSEDRAAELVAQRNEFQALIMRILPDLELDYPDNAKVWRDYATRLNPNKPLPQIPEPNTDQEKRFLVGQNIMSRYYALKNAEINFAKRRLEAPFSGVLTEALVNPGALIRPGQRLGRFIQSGTYELELAIPYNQAKRIMVGDHVTVYGDAQKTKSYKAEIIRINQGIDASSQTLQVYAKLTTKELSDGMYLTAEIPIQPIPNSIQIDRNLLLDEGSVFLVSDNKLKRAPVTVEYQTNQTAIISGLKDGDVMVAKRVPGGFEGMPVAITDEKPQS